MFYCLLLPRFWRVFSTICLSMTIECCCCYCCYMLWRYVKVTEAERCQERYVARVWLNLLTRRGVIIRFSLVFWLSFVQFLLYYCDLRELWAWVSTRCAAFEANWWGALKGKRQQLEFFPSPGLSCPPLVFLPLPSSSFWLSRLVFHLHCRSASSSSSYTQRRCFPWSQVDRACVCASCSLSPPSPFVLLVFLFPKMEQLCFKIALRVTGKGLWNLSYSLNWS